MNDWEAVLLTMKEEAAKEILVMWEKVPVPSLIDRPVPRLPRLSVPQEKRPDDQRSLEVVAVLQEDRFAPKSWEDEE